MKRDIKEDIKEGEQLSLFNEEIIKNKKILYCFNENYISKKPTLWDNIFLFLRESDSNWFVFLEIESGIYQMISNNFYLLT